MRLIHPVVTPSINPGGQWGQGHCSRCGYRNRNNPRNRNNNRGFRCASTSVLVTVTVRPAYGRAERRPIIRRGSGSGPGRAPLFGEPAKYIAAPAGPVGLS
jgi:hypothetical protein